MRTLYLSFVTPKRAGLIQCFRIVSRRWRRGVVETRSGSPITYSGSDSSRSSSAERSYFSSPEDWEYRTGGHWRDYRQRPRPGPCSRTGSLGWRGVVALVLLLATLATTAAACAAATMMPARSRLPRSGSLWRSLGGMTSGSDR